MAKEVLDVVDTAVKIGLGALISGVATYYVTRLKHKEESAQEATKRKWELLEGALDAANDYTFALGELFSVIDGLRRDNPTATTIKETGGKDYLEENDKTFLLAAPKRIHAISRLKIIGEEKAAESLYKLHVLEDEIRLKVIFDGALPTEEELRGWYAKLQSVRESFLAELAKLQNA